MDEYGNLIILYNTPLYNSHQLFSFASNTITFPAYTTWGWFVYQNSYSFGTSLLYNNVDGYIYVSGNNYLNDVGANNLFLEMIYYDGTISDTLTY